MLSRTPAPPGKRTVKLTTTPAAIWAEASLCSTATGYTWRSYAPTPEAVAVTCSVSGAVLGDAVRSEAGVDGCGGIGITEE